MKKMKSYRISNLIFLTLVVCALSIDFDLTWYQQILELSENAIFVFILYRTFKFGDFSSTTKLDGRVIKLFIILIPLTIFNNYLVGKPLFDFFNILYLSLLIYIIYHLIKYYRTGIKSQESLQ